MTDAVKTRGDALEARCLVYTEPGKAEIKNVSAFLGAGGERLKLKALWSGISRGTERLVANGNVPEGEYARMRAPFQHGDFPFPVGYGYSWVGSSDDGNDTCWFGLFPHQDSVCAAKTSLIRLPEGLSAHRAVLGANMETALNVCWDAGVGPCDDIAVVGGGVLGLLVAGIASDIPGTRVTVVDVNGRRGSFARDLGAEFALPEDARGGRDLVIHTSASQAGLETALRLAGKEATVVEASWFGTREPSLPLGAAFHSRRLTLKSSQVGMVSPLKRPRWDHARRLEAALSLLRNDKYDALITGEVRFEDLPQSIHGILAPEADGLATAVSYL